MKTRKPFNIERVREFCKLVNEGKQPKEALLVMRSSMGYATALKAAGLYWKEKDGTYKAVERIYAERYELFLTEKKKFIRQRNESYHVRQKQKTFEKVKAVSKSNSYKEYTKQATLFNQPKPKQTSAPTMKAKERQLTFIQRVVKSLFNL